jgi:hypothetical protein
MYTETQPVNTRISKRKRQLEKSQERIRIGKANRIMKQSSALLMGVPNIKTYREQTHDSDHEDV